MSSQKRPRRDIINEQMEGFSYSECSVLYHKRIHATPTIYFISSLTDFTGRVLQRFKQESGIVSELVFWDGLRPRECVEQLVPEVLLAPSEVGGVFEIEPDLLGQLIIRGQVSQLDDDDAGNVVFQGLDVGQLELQKAPLAFTKIPEKKEQRLSVSEEQDSFHRNPVTGERIKENYFRPLPLFFIFYTYCNGLLL
ncbi:hypothetical protein CDAR_561941 [Caerostris darwini]|uniref:Uncharacterized protein n=1 Tax=Caerostris darwini TaxID=1538125 RepID=A0AAV4Q851_9ARAC|nr:hypothetical protein CDAR_561941 [Caerostris darwini]